MNDLSYCKSSIIRTSRCSDCILYNTISVFFSKIFRFYFLCFFGAFIFLSYNSNAQDINKAWDYYKNEQYELAATEFEKVIEISEKTYGQDITSAHLSFFAGFSFNKTNNKEKAIIFYSKSIETYKTLPNNKIDAWYGVCLNNLASIKKAQGKLETAEQLFSKALTITETTEGKKSENYSIRLNNLAELYGKMGNTQKATPLYLEAIEIIENNFGKENKWYGTFLDNLAISYEENGQYEKALSLHLEALKYTEISVGKDHPDYSIRLNNTATCYRYLGQFSNAFNFSEEALVIARRTLNKDDPSIGKKLFNLASIYMEYGQYERALSYSYENCFDVLLNDVDLNKYEIPDALNQIAELHIYLGQYEYADSALNMAMKFIDYNDPEFGEDYCNLLNTYGYYNKCTGDFENSLFFYELALKGLNEFDTLNDQAYSAIFNNISEIYGLLGNYTKSLDFQILSFNKLKAHLDIFSAEYETCITNLALDYILNSNYDKALDLVIEAIKISKRRITESFTFLSTKERGDYLKESNSTSLFLPSLVYKLIDSFPTISTLEYNNELFTNTILLNTSIEIQQSILISQDTALVSAFEEFKNLRRQINFLQQQPQEKQQKLPELEEKANQLDKQLTKASQDYKKNKENLNIQWQDVQKGLKEDEAAIAFISFPYYNKTWTDSILYCALVVKPGMEYPAMIPLFEQKQLDSLLLKSYSSPNVLYASRGTKLSYNNLSTSITQNGNELYNLIWKPLEKELQYVNSVYFSPSGTLHQISFAALPVDSTQLLSDKYDLHQLTSTQQIATSEWKNQYESITSASLFGGITYDMDERELSKLKPDSTSDLLISSQSFTPDSSQRSTSFNFLAGSNEEVQNIASQFKEKNISVSLYSGSNGDEATFKNLSNQDVNVLHIATHGFYIPIKREKPNDFDRLQFSGEQKFRYIPNPLLRSGLILAGGNHTWKGEDPIPGIEDGILTAQEISEMNLFNTDLVVLSACETGLGDIKGGEGVFGLQRAFKLAGVKTIIMSLWKVPDQQTSMLMQVFYKNWLNGMSKHEAFKAAQQIVRKDFPEPYYWAGFVMVD